MDNQLENSLSSTSSPTPKPRCKLIGEDGNIFNLVGIASRTLKRAGLHDEAKKMQEEIRASGSYDKALMVLDKYVDIVGDDDENDDENEN